jgi:hypothetical protein
VVADKSSQLVLDALSRAATDPTGLPLHGSKSLPGLFPTSPPARLAAQRCVAEGLLRVVRTETKGKAPLQYCAVTEKGLARLLDQVSPRQVLEDLVRTLEARQDQVGELVESARHWQAGLETLKDITRRVLEQLPKSAAIGPVASTNGSPAWHGQILSCLVAWPGSGDPPLPELYRRVCEVHPSLTIGQFHDGLRRLYAEEQIYLHPWTGPLYDLPEPTYALLVGHEIAYYASLRKETPLP